MNNFGIEKANEKIIVEYLNCIKLVSNCSDDCFMLDQPIVQKMKNQQQDNLFQSRVCCLKQKLIDLKESSDDDENETELINRIVDFLNKKLVITIEDLENCFKSVSKSLFTAYLNEGISLDELDKYEEAIIQFDNAIRIDKNKNTQFMFKL